tara:strand:- start:2568 stop:3188 length:621 start_codon:yes stop_codon:yes gene_type:complete
MEAKVCGVKDYKTLNYLLNHKYPPKFIGFICNYPKSKRHLDFKKLEKLINFNRKPNINFVSVLVSPKKNFLKKISKLKFDYLQLYDVDPKETLRIKNDLNVKIISSITVQKKQDVMLYKKYKDISEIILFDSKGYEKSLKFNHKFLKDISDNITTMLAGDIKYNEKLDKYKKITDIIDLSGSLETNGEKDISKINIFLKNITNLKK